MKQKNATKATALNPKENKATKQELLDELYKPYEKCLKCPLGGLGRKNVAFGSGNANATLIMVGEAPGKEEDEQGLPFVGRSGKLLTKALLDAGIERKDVYITNVVKCRPPNNRKPMPKEIATCTNLLLENQIKIINPTIICTMGSVALDSIMGSKNKITQIRGSILYKNDIKVIPIFHPAYILRNKNKFLSWVDDLKLINAILKNSQ